MGESKHTPGPWEWVVGGSRGEYFDGALRGQFGDAGAIYPILNVRLGEIEAATVVVHEANARIIAVAPLMLEALRDEERWLESLTPAHIEGASAAVKIGVKNRLIAVRAAIKAATGGDRRVRGCEHPIEPNGGSCVRCGRPAWVSGTTGGEP